MARYAPTWIELQDKKRVSDYEDQTFGLQWMDAEPYFGKTKWFWPTALQGKDWQLFRDPAGMTYYKYVTERAKKADQANALFEMAPDVFSGITDTWKRVWDQFIAPHKFIKGQLSIQFSAMSSYVKSSFENFFLSFECFDELNHASFIVQLTRILRDKYGICMTVKDRWVSADDFQPLRRLIEELAVVDDRYESGFVAHLILDPVIRAVQNVLREESPKHRDYVTAKMLDLIHEDEDWHYSAAYELYRARVADVPGNGETLLSWSRRWSQPVRDAVLPWAAGLDAALDSGGRFAAAVDQALGEVDQQVHRLTV